jgi:type I restriction enzyme S subunit
VTEITFEKKHSTAMPDGWVNTNLEDVVDILDSRRVPVNAEDREKRRGTIPYYGATGQVGWINDYLFDEELILLGEDGAPFLEPTKQKAYIIHGKSWVNNHAHVLRARNGILNAYIKYYLDIVDYHKFVSGTTRLKLNQSAMRQIPVPIAPPDQQKRIVAEIEKQFSRLDEAVAALKRIQANLKRYKASVLKSAVEGKLTEQWRKEHPDVEPASQLLKHILSERRRKWEEDYVKKYLGAHGDAPKDDSWKKKYKEPAALDTSNLPKLPEGWVWMNADQCTSLITDGEHITPQRSSSGVFLLSARNVHDGKLLLDEVDYIPEQVYEKLSQRFIAEHGDVLLSCSGTVGRSCVVPQDIKFAMVRSIAILKPLFKMGTFFSFAIRSSLLQSQIEEKKTQTAQANIFQGKIKTLVFPIPPLDEQKVIVEEIESRLSIVKETEDTAETNLKRADRLRHSILKKAFSGRLIKENNIRRIQYETR